MTEEIKVLNHYIHFQLFPVGVGSKNLWAYDLCGLTDPKQPFFVAFYSLSDIADKTHEGANSAKGQSLESFIAQTIGLVKNNTPKIIDLDIDDIYTSKWRAKNRATHVEKIVRGLADEHHIAINEFDYDLRVDAQPLTERIRNKISGYLIKE